MGLWPVSIDMHQIRQVINNIIINAKEAMDNKGNFEVYVFNKIERYNLYRESKSWVVITFKDYGKGLEKKDLERIFEPYFTKKPSGTGLGLAISSSIIDNHNGRIEVSSNLNYGTSFSVYLPAYN